MAGQAATDLLIDIAKKAAQQAIDATVLHVGYVVKYKSNINNLDEIAEEVKSTRLDAEDYLNSVGDNNEGITNTSADLLVKLEAAEKTADGIKTDTEKLKMGCWCPNPIKRYRLSKKAVKEAEKIKKLQDQAKPYCHPIKPALPASKLIGARANDLSKDFESRVKIMEEIIAAVNDDKISIIGVCGTEGVGKTTLMHELRERAKVNDLFHEVVMATVSQNPDMSILRHKLADMLGLISVKDEKNEIAVADELHKRLTRRGRRTLVILDDIWSEVNLQELGIPVGSDNTGCKVVLVSRQFSVCIEMKAQKTITVAYMPPKEAWYLFRKMAGDCMTSDDLRGIAEQVANECGGLPIALVTLAKALSGKKIGIWRDALKQLREHNVTRIPGMDKNVYSSIKMNFDFLESQQPEAKPLLFLCCQHPKNAEIEVESLARYCLALGLLEDVHSIEDARNRVCALIDYLKSCFLLEAVEVDDMDKNRGLEKVKVHDVVRDVGLSILSSSKEEKDKVYMHVAERAVIDGEAADCQNLKIVLHKSYDGRPMNSLSFVSQMKEMRVLEYSPERNFQGLPLEALINLHMLCIGIPKLDECIVSEIGKLTNLEILSFLNSYHSGPFPLEIGKLVNLKFLDMRFKYTKQYPLPSGILPQLTKLEVLCLGGYYFARKPEDENGINAESDARIAELETLSNLTTLQFQLENPMELVDLKFIFEKLERFSFSRLLTMKREISPLVWRELDLLKLSNEWILGDKIQSIVRRTEELRLTAMDWRDPLLLEKFESLQILVLGYFKLLEYVIYDGAALKNLKTLYILSSGVTELCHNGNLPVGSLEKLRELYLTNLPNMRHLWLGPTDPLSLVNLTGVRVQRCGTLEYIFPYSAAKCLVQLQVLTIGECGSMKAIVSKGEGTATEERGEIIQEPIDVHIVNFPKLTKLTVEESFNLRGFYDHDGVADDDSRVQSLLSPLVMLPSMEKLDARELNQLKQIVTCGTVDNLKFTASNWLQNLQYIYVKSCASLESVFDFEGIQFMEENAHVVTLDMLKEISLALLPKLTSIFRCRIEDISIPELQNICVSNCDMLGNLVASNLIKKLNNLKYVDISDCESIEAVFNFEGMEVIEEDECAILGELQSIIGKNLPKLEHVCKLAPKGIHVFQNLRKLFLKDCGKLAYLFSSSIAIMLEKLDYLSIMDSKSIEEVIATNEETSEKKIVFRSLNEIQFCDLEKLSSFCSSEQLEFEFPSLEIVSVVGCPEMKMFCNGHLTAEKLRKVYFDCGAQDVWESDLNKTVQHFNARDLKENDEDAVCVEDCNDNDNDNGNDDEDENNVDDDINGAAQQLNTRGNQLNNDLKQEAVGDYNAEDVVDSHVPEKSVHDEYIHDDNEGTSDDQMKALSAPPPPDTLIKVALPPITNSQVEHFNASDVKEDDFSVASAAALDDHEAEAANQVLDPSGTSIITQQEKGTVPELFTTEVLPNASPQTTAHSNSSATTLNNTHESVFSSSADLIKVISFGPDDHKSSRTLIQGVYVKSNMSSTFEEIVTKNPNFLSSLRVKSALIKTALVETAINCLQILSQSGLSSEQLEYVRDSLDDLVVNGLDVAWLERNYQRASIEIDEQKAVFLAAELDRLEKEKKEDEAAFQMAREKLEASTELYEALRTELDGLMQSLESRKEHYGDGFDLQRSTTTTYI